MRNITTKIAGSKLVIEVDLSKQSVRNARPSSTGKTLLLASSEGAQSVACNVPGLKIAVNITIPTGVTAESVAA